MLIHIYVDINTHTWFVPGLVCNFLKTLIFLSCEYCYLKHISYAERTASEQHTQERITVFVWVPYFKVSEQCVCGFLFCPLLETSLHCGLCRLTLIFLGLLSSCAWKNTSVKATLLSGTLWNCWSSPSFFPLPLPSLPLSLSCRNSVGLSKDYWIEVWPHSNTVIWVVYKL